MYCGAEMNEEEKAALKSDPEFRVYKRIDEIDLEVEIEKGCKRLGITSWARIITI